MNAFDLGTPCSIRVSVRKIGAIGVFVPINYIDIVHNANIITIVDRMHNSGFEVERVYRVQIGNGLYIIDYDYPETYNLKLIGSV